MVKSAEGCTREELRALLEIRNSTDNLGLASWDGKDCCEFDGVICFGERVDTLIFPKKSNSTLGTWRPNMTLFTAFDKLTALILSDLKIGGDFQAFCELTKLKDLTILDISQNLLEGSIPPCFESMRNLHEVDLSSNLLSGDIPPSIFSNQSRIYRFDVSDNHLEGLLPFSIFANSSFLSYLDLSHNYLVIDTESPSWIPKFSLDILGLANCNLNKNKNHVLPSFISTQHNLEWLDLSHNSLEGSIPCWLLCSERITTLFLRGNKFSSLFFDSCKPNRTSLLQAFDISDNRIKGSLPDNIGELLPDLRHVNMSSNLLEGSIPSSTGIMPLEILDASNNMFSGAIPSSLTRTDSRLVYLNLSNNSLRGEMLPRNSNMSNLECLQLSGNHFQGTLSPAISRSPSLVILDARNNDLSGSIPNWLYQHPHLVAVLLGGNNIDGHLRRRMCQMTTLQVLDLSNNYLSGGIPTCLDNITFRKRISPSADGANYFTKNGLLQYLMDAYSADTDFDIGANFTTKHVLYYFRGRPLSLMTGLDLSSNRLAGNIPPEIGELSQLQALNLSNNLLTGPIPPSFRYLKSTESLDLSHNNLSGQIPPEIIELTFLSIFSVAYNNLSGRIPFTQQFLTFDLQSYIGNPLLCGSPLPRSCSSTKHAEPQPENEKEGTSVIDSPLFFYAFVYVSYALGFWVFFGVLLYNQRWRQNYFRAVDRYILSFFEWLYRYTCS